MYEFVLPSSERSARARASEHELCKIYFSVVRFVVALSFSLSLSTKQRPGEEQIKCKEKERRKMETKFSAEKRARYDAVANACLRKCHLQVSPIEKK